MIFRKSFTLQTLAEIEHLPQSVAFIEERVLFLYRAIKFEDQYKVDKWIKGGRGTGSRMDYQP
ncbi:hypothetical protein ACQCVM_22935 [Rossellomorea aquimaris]|uniref:hypothetical protein n=1 Tax=Bacillus sp. CH30_1T TaxID=2604836 RepID=UPI00165E354B|nr:hypothetical protein [Bacillus sp. CH30_1T]